MSSCPNMTKFAYGVARRVAQVPHDITDEEAEAQAMISPVMIELIMTVVAELLKQCLANRTMGWRRVRNFCQAKESVRRADKISLSLRIEQWANRLGVSRENGDVRAIREAITAQADGLDEEAFSELHAESMFLTI